MEFKVIESQEELDGIIGERLARQANKIRAEYADYEELKEKVQNIASLESKSQEDATTISELRTQLADASNKCRGYELENMRTTIAIETGLPLELRSRLNGQNEEEIRKDAESLSQFFKKSKNSFPGFKQNEHIPSEDNTENQYKEILRSLRKE